MLDHFDSGECALILIPLLEGLVHLVNGGRETDLITLGVVNSIVELHEGVAKKVHLFDTLVARVQIADSRLAIASLFRFGAELTPDPLLRGQGILNAIDDIGDLRKAQKVLI
mmetsp:Transcript_14879/g.20144  ORF Transcript_14879/g.20144 Transcript_14879/m.20144 type:complete len:112 (-) Transcript_14879:31-366(-)